MKRLLLVICCLSFIVSAQAQDTIPHLKFMGYSMGVPIADFTQNVRQRFPLQKKVGGDQYYIYRGNVYGHDCYFKGEYTRKTKTLYKITVTPKQIDQNALADSICAHYGDAMEIANGMRWNVEGGTILLYLPQGYDPVLMYFDEQGVARFREEDKK